MSSSLRFREPRIAAGLSRNVARRMQSVRDSDTCDSRQREGHAPPNHQVVASESVEERRRHRSQGESAHVSGSHRTRDYAESSPTENCSVITGFVMLVTP